MLFALFKDHSQIIVRLYPSKQLKNALTQKTSATTLKPKFKGL